MVRSLHLAPALLAALAAASVAACSSGPSNTGVEHAAKAPAAISGGSMALSKDGRTAIVADTERDRVVLVDVASMAITKTVQLEEGDEPGRVAEDAAGRVHVALRGAGAVATIDPSAGSVVERTKVCSAPRGVTFDAATNNVYVACAAGELVTLPAAGGAAKTLELDRDIRDVVVQNGQLYVSHFRSAEISSVDPVQGIETGRTRPTSFQGPSRSFSPTVAWRTQSTSSGKIVVVHQHSGDSAVPTSTPGGYDGSSTQSVSTCDSSIVHGAVSVLDPTTQQVTTLAPLAHAAVPVDLDAIDFTNADGNADVQVAVAAAGSERVILTSLVKGGADQALTPGCPSENQVTIFVPDQPVAVRFLNASTVLVQTRNAPKLIRYELESDGWAQVAQVELANATELTTIDTGHDLFHKASSASATIACASCHPEGSDDGHVWTFENGPRRTQNIRGGVLDTAPFHWDGDMADLSMIMSEVFVHRMGGKTQDPAHIEAIQAWVGTIPFLPVKATGTPAAIAHGKALFESDATGCATCHNGPKLTNNQNAFVGTDPNGRAFQVPSLLGLAHRAPFFHDGSILTLRDRFTNPAAGGEQHGHTAQLSDQDIDDMVAYLESL